MSFLSWFLVIYGVLALSHIAFQMILGHLEYKKQHKRKFKKYHESHVENVSVVIPSYNEKPQILIDSIESILKQKGVEFDLFVVDDGSKNINEMNEKVYNKYEKVKNVNIIRSPENIGKRHVQKLAFDKIKSDIVVTIDSDTILQSKNILRGIIKRFKNPEVGAITGDVRVENEKVNLLTRLISYRYWTAFHQERAAQSYFNVLMCCSGPFSAYRMSIIDKVKDKYINQKFMGNICTFGDDRHLTNLVLEEGHKVVFDTHTKVYTHVPEKMSGYIKQQIRWNKSFYREMIWTYKSINKHHWYMIYDLTMQLILPFLLITALVAMVYQVFTYQDLMHLWKYIAILVGIALIRSIYAVYRTRDIGFLLFVVYGFIHVLVLLPVRLYALLTINKIKWGTR